MSQYSEYDAWAAQKAIGTDSSGNIYIKDSEYETNNEIRVLNANNISNRTMFKISAVPKSSYKKGTIRNEKDI